MAASKDTEQTVSPAPQGPEVAVVVPVLNEAGNVAPLIGEIRQALDGRYDYEVVYVDDGSGDETADRLRQIAAEFPRLKALRHHHRCGQSAAIATGIAAARAPLIATIDGDGQNDPAAIPELLEAFAAAAAGDRDNLMVTGLRAVRRDTWLKRAASRIANVLRAGLLKDHTPDTGCGLKVFSRAAFLDMPRFDHMHRFLPALMVRRGGRVVSIPVNHRPRRVGTSNYGVLDRLWVGIADLFGVMWLQRRASRPEVEELRESVESVESVESAESSER